MANLILLKKSSVAAKVPTTGDLDYGELALNYADGALYYKTSGNAIARLNPPESVGFANVAVSGQSTLVADTAAGTLTVAAGNGAITVTTNSGTDTLTISHADTSSVANLSSDNSAGVVLQDIAFTFDTYGHVQTATVATTNLDSRYLQTESDTLATVTTRGNTTANSITIGGLTVNGNSSLAGDVTNVDSVSFDLTAAEGSAVGKLYWDAGFGLLRYGLGGGNVDIDIGQTEVAYVRNAETTTITKGQVVYLFGAQGDRPSVKLAYNTTDTTSAKTFGIAAENIAANSDGFVVTVGTVTGVDTSMYAAGDILWLGSTPGTVTTTKPIAPNHGVFVGVVQKVNPAAGQVYVRVQNGFELNEIHDVLITAVNSNHSLFYDSSVNLWKNYAPSAARTNLGLGTIATQNANSVAITGGAIDGTPIGATTPSTGKFTTVQTTGNVIVGGNLTVTGTTTTVNAQNLAISDNLIMLNNGIQTTITNVSGSGTVITYTTLETHNYTTNMSVTVTGVNPSQYNIANQTITGVTSNTFTVAGSATGTYVSGGIARGMTNANPDLGFAAGYNDGTYRHAGFFRDATDGYFKPFKNYTPEPDADIYIDTSHASFALADIQAANFRGALVGNATTASTLAGTPTINGVTFNGGSNITITASTTNALTIGDGLSGTSFNGSSAVTIAVNSTVARRSDELYVGTTAIALNRASAAQSLTGINGITGSTTGVAINAGGSNQSITVAPSGTGLTVLGQSIVGVSYTNATVVNSTGFTPSVFGGPRLSLVLLDQATAFGSSPYSAIGFYGARGPGTYDSPFASILGGKENTTQGNNQGYFDIYTTASNTVPTFALRVDSAQRVGIGTASPAYKLHVNVASTGVGARFNNGGNYFDIGGFSSGTAYIRGWENIVQFGNSYNGHTTFITNDTERMRIDNSGNVGIGTTSPSARLNVVGGDFYLEYKGSGSFQAPKIRLLGGDSAGLNNSFDIKYFKTASTDRLGFIDGGAVECLSIVNGGNVGIGTISPNTTLHVYKTTNDAIVKAQTTAAGAYFQADSATDGFYGLKLSNSGTSKWFVGGYGTSDFTFQLSEGGTEYVRIARSSGNVGIGTASPSQKLEVTGNIKLTNGGYIYGDGANAQLHLSNALGSQLIYGSVAVRALAASVKLVATSEEISLVNNNGSLWLTGAGNVGIATSSPAHKLDINGNVNISAGNPLRWGSGNAEIVDSSYNLLFKVYDGTSSVQERLRITSAGNVGIGTTTPNEKLEVGGNISIRTASGTYGSLRFGTTNASYLDTWAGIDSDWESTGVNVGNLRFYTAYGTRSEKMRITSGGNVGIGTTTPASKLDVNGISTLRDTINIGPSIGVISWGSMGGGTGFGIRSESGRALSLGANAAWDYLVINTSGNVGIGTAFPSYKLHVMGDARMGANGQRLYFYDDGNAHIHSTSTPLWINSEDNSNIYINHQYNGGVILTKSGGGNVGIGEASPTQKLHVTGNARITGALYDSANSAGTNGQVLTSTGTGTAWSSTGAAVTGTGTTGKIPKWSATTALADSVITESSGNIGIDTTPTQKLDVNGNIGWGTNHVLAYSTITTTATTANQVITSVSATTYRTFKFVIQAVDATAGKYQSQEIMAIHNGSTVAHTEYTAINVGGAVATYDVDISGSTVRLLCTPLSANSTVFKVSMQLIKV